MAKKAKFASVCGMDEIGVDQFLAAAEQEDKGTDRFPWPAKLKAEIKAAISGMQFMPHVMERVNEIVVAEAGPGLLGRGPFFMPQGTGR